MALMRWVFLLTFAAVLMSARAADLEKCVARAEAIFLTSFDSNRNPKLKVEKILYQDSGVMGQMALEQGAWTLRRQLSYKSSSSVQGSRQDIVFARMMKGDQFNGTGALLDSFQLQEGTFYCLGQPATLAEVEKLIAQRKE